MRPIEPAHMHGENKGLEAASSSSPRQILHTSSSFSSTLSASMG